MLVNYGDRVGYADTLEDALDQVFGPGTGQPVTDGGEAPPTDGETAAPTSPSAPTSPTAPPADGGSPSNPEMAQAAADISAALEALKTAQRDGDFAAQGQALADLETAVEAYQAAQQASGRHRESAPATPTG